MENIKLVLGQSIFRMKNLLQKIKLETRKIKPLILKPGITDMLKNIFAGIEAMLRAVIYLLILLMGISIAGLGAYAILFLALRIGQFLWVLILKEKWL
jgi:hypothetical protein